MMKTSKRKALGQHFLKDEKIMHRIVDVIAPEAGDTIIEIGAGKGALTFLLAETGAEIIALEKDKTLIPFLEKKRVPNLTVMEEDALRIPFGDLLQGRPGKIVGNLPYAISSPLMFKVLGERDFVTLGVFLLQKEVAQRMCALPGTKKYAPLSILFQNDFETRIHFRVMPSSFSPPPKVESALISLKKRRKPVSEVPHQEDFIAFIKGAFRNRRKKLANNLKALGISSPRIKKAYLLCGIGENLRPEQVSLSGFVALYTALSRDLSS